MRKFTFLSFLLCLFISGAGFAQKQKTSFYRNVDVHVMPIALAFPDPSIRIGSEYMTNGRWSYGLSLGAGLNVLSLNKSFRSGGKNYNMLEVRPEVKYYWFRNNQMGWYGAVEGMFVHVNRRLGKDSHFLTDSTEVQFDGARFTKNKLGFAGKIGVKFLLRKRLTIDMYTGLGLARNNVKYSEIQNPTEGVYDPFFEWENFYPGKKTSAIVSFGVKFGFLVWEE
jgi:hypothetical protein